MLVKKQVLAPLARQLAILRSTALQINMIQMQLAFPSHFPPKQDTYQGITKGTKGTDKVKTTLSSCYELL